MTVIDQSAPDRAAPDRAALARAALARAEERTGTERWVRPLRVTPLEPGPGQVEHGREHGRVETGPEPAERLLPVTEDLVALLPSGGLERGSTVVVSGSTSLALAMVAQASQAGSWVAVVGLPEVGVLAAHQLGLDLDRVVLVPTPGPDGPTVVAALLDGVDVVVVGPQTALADGDRRRLSARARERSAVLLPTTPWSGAQVVLSAGVSRWEGLGRGHGRLRSRRLTVQRSGRGTAARVAQVEVGLPAAPPTWATWSGPADLPTKVPAASGPGVGTLRDAPLGLVVDAPPDGLTDGLLDERRAG